MLNNTTDILREYGYSVGHISDKYPETDDPCLYPIQDVLKIQLTGNTYYIEYEKERVKAKEGILPITDDEEVLDKIFKYIVKFDCLLFSTYTGEGYTYDNQLRIYLNTSQIHNYSHTDGTLITLEEFLYLYDLTYDLYDNFEAIVAFCAYKRPHLKDQIKDKFQTPGYFKYLETITKYFS